MTGNGLSDRLKCVASMVSAGTYVFDVGCDHAFLDIYLIRQGIARGASASDVKKGPLEAASEHISQAGLEDKISTVLSDGLHNINDIPEGSTLVMAGMGGPLILKILTDEQDKTSKFDEIIISPQSRITDVREGLKDIGLAIADEAMVFDDGKYYTVMKLVKAEGGADSFFAGCDKTLIAATDPESAGLIEGFIKSAGEGAERIFMRYGPVLVARKDEVLLQYLKWEKAILKGVLKELSDSGHDERYLIKAGELMDNEITGKWMEGEAYGNDQN